MILDGKLDIENGEFIPYKPTISSYHKLLFFVSFGVMDVLGHPVGFFIDTNALVIGNRNCIFLDEEEML